MSRVDDAGKLMQDFVAPELRAIAVRLDSMEKQNLDRDKTATERHVALLDKVDASRRETLLQVELSLANRRIEELQSRQQGMASQ